MKIIDKINKLLEEDQLQNGSPKKQLESSPGAKKE
jgi:hypothetical protein